MDLVLTLGVQAAQARSYGISQTRPGAAPADTFEEDETALIEGMDGFTLAL